MQSVDFEKEKQMKLELLHFLKLVTDALLKILETFLKILVKYDKTPVLIYLLYRIYL